jgi:hypothetical protein
MPRFSCWPPRTSGWTVLGLAFPLTIGRFHYGAIGCNGIVLLFTAAAALMKKTNIPSQVLAAALTFLVWDYLGVIRLLAVNVMRNFYCLNRCIFMPA